MVQFTVATAAKPSTDVGLPLPNRTMSDLQELAKNEKTQINSGKWDTIIPNPKSRKTPRLCFFVTTLIFLMVAAVVLVLVIKLSLSREDAACCKSKLLKNPEPSQAPKPTKERARTKDTEGINSNKEESRLKPGISWEMKRAFMELRQIIGDFNPTLLFPVYRKDLPAHYIAYYEVTLKHAKGQSYAVISAGEKTGDYSLVETGGSPSPLEKLRAKVHLNGHYCSKFFRLTMDGVTICEDQRLNRIVATSGDIQPKSPVRDWEELDEQVSKSLPRLKANWQSLANIVNKVKEWKVFGKSKNQGKSSSNVDGAVTERGLTYGQFVEIPVQNVTEVQIKFVGLSKAESRVKAVNISLRKWQIKLCRVLNDVCDPQNPTSVRKNASIINFAGSKYLKFGVNADEEFIKTELDNQDIRFLVELNMGRGEKIIMHYGIVLGVKRLGRSVEPITYEIPNEKSFPKIRYDKECWGVGTMLSAWAMIFSHYDNLAKLRPELGYRKLGFNRGKNGRLFSTAKERHNYIGKVIASKMGATCSLLKQKASYWDKRKLEHWFEEHQGVRSRIMYLRGLHKRAKATRKATSLLKKGIPVVISTDKNFTLNPTYAVVTRMRQRRSSYRHCDKIDDCSLWEEINLTEFFVRDGSSTGKWHIACTYYAAAAIKQ